MQQAPPAHCPLPAEVEADIREMANRGRTGQVLLNFNSGRIESWEVKEKHRVKGAKA